MPRATQKIKSSIKNVIKIVLHNEKKKRKARRRRVAKESQEGFNQRLKDLQYISLASIGGKADSGVKQPSHTVNHIYHGTANTVESTGRLAGYASRPASSKASVASPRASPLDLAGEIASNHSNSVGNSDLLSALADRGAEITPAPAPAPLNLLSGGGAEASESSVRRRGRPSRDEGMSLPVRSIRDTARFSNADLGENLPFYNNPTIMNIAQHRLNMRRAEINDFIRENGMDNFTTYIRDQLI